MKIISQLKSTPTTFVMFVLSLVALVSGSVALYASYNAWSDAKASQKAAAKAWEIQAAKVASSKWDIPGWNCSNTTTKEPGQQERLVKQICTSGTRIELESPSQ